MAPRGAIRIGTCVPEPDEGLGAGQVRGRLRRDHRRWRRCGRTSSRWPDPELLAALERRLGSGVVAGPIAELGAGRCAHRPRSARSVGASAAHSRPISRRPRCSPSARDAGSRSRPCWSPATTTRRCGPACSTSVPAAWTRSPRSRGAISARRRTNPGPIAARSARLRLREPLAQRGELGDDVVEPVLDRLEPPGERAEPLLEPLDVGDGGEIERPHRASLRRHRPLAGAQRLAEGGVEDRVLDQGLRELADRFLAAGADVALLVVAGVHLVGAA